jgi:hypothetical protein
VENLKLFDDEALYRRAQIKAKLGGISDRKTDGLLADVRRVSLGSKKCIGYVGADLNAVISRGLVAGRKPAAPTGAVAEMLRDPSKNPSVKRIAADCAEREAS